MPPEKQSNARWCSKACEKAAYYATPKGRAVVRMSNAKYRATPRGRDKKAANNTAYRATPKGKAKHNASSAAYYSTHKVEENAKTAARRATPEGRAKTAEAKAKYNATPKGREKHQSQENKRRAMKAEVRHAPYTRQQVIDRDGIDCHICGKPGDPQKMHIEHIIPISHGGPDVLYNVKLAHPFCNLSKGTKFIGTLAITLGPLRASLRSAQTATTAPLGALTSQPLRPTALIVAQHLGVGLPNRIPPPLKVIREFRMHSQLIEGAA